MNWKTPLFCFLAFSSSLAAKVSLDISFERENPLTNISETLFFEKNSSAEFTTGDIRITVNVVQPEDLEKGCGDFAFELTMYQNNEVMLKPTLCVEWDKEATLYLTKTDEDENIIDSAALTIIASNME